MTIDRVINLLAMITLVELMITIGLGATIADVRDAARDWRFALRAALANYVIVPALAVGLVMLFHANPMVAAGVMVVAVCPGAPYGPPFTALARGRVDRAVGLMVILAGSSALLAPLLLQALLPVVARGSTVTIDGGRIVSTLIVAQFLPLCAGLALAAYHPARAKALRTPFARLSTLLNLTLLVVILVAQFHLLAAIRPRGYFGMALLLAGSAAAGWLLGGRAAADRKTLAITTAVRNVGVGLVIAGGSFPGTPAVTFVTAYALVQTVVTAAVVIAIGRRSAPAGAAASPSVAQPEPYRPAATS